MIKKKYFKTNDTCEVTFELPEIEAESVALVCEHNEWTPVEMKKAKDGTFRTKIKVDKNSRYQYRFLVEGQTWENDDHADDYVSNRFGTRNCVVDTTQAQA